MPYLIYKFFLIIHNAKFMIIVTLFLRKFRKEKNLKFRSLFFLRKNSSKQAIIIEVQ